MIRSNTGFQEYDITCHKCGFNHKGFAPPMPRHCAKCQADLHNIPVSFGASETTPRPSKASVLDTAKAAVADRGLNYGKPEDNFQRIADRWRTHLKNRFGIDVPIDPASVAMMMSDMKIARLENDPTHMDSWVDIAGYAACGGEIAGAAKKEA